MAPITFFSICVWAIFLPAAAPAQFFGQRQDNGIVTSNSLDEASGIAPSRRNSQVLWTHNDSGDSPRIFAISTAAKVLAIYGISNAVNRDWEDICTGSINGNPYIFIADIGDNLAQYDTLTIYKIPEPFVNENQPIQNDILTASETIRYRYPDGKRDAESLMFDKLTNDLYVVSKREDSVRVYRLPYPQPIQGVATAEKVATLPLTMIVGGDISVNGTAILLKNYSKVYYFRRLLGESIGEALSKPPVEVSVYQQEPQGEAICFDWAGAGFFTISEESMLQIPAHLYYYRQTAQDITEEMPKPSNIDTVMQSDRALLINFTLASGCEATFLLMDMSAKVITLGTTQRLQAGQQQVSYPTGDLSSGAYRLFLRVRDDIHSVKPVVIQR